MTERKEKTIAVKDLLNKIKDLTGAAAEEAAETAETVTEEVKEEAQEIIGEHKRPEPPKDENGDPMRPPEGMKPPFGFPKPEETGSEN